MDRVRQAVRHYNYEQNIMSGVKLLGYLQFTINMNFPVILP